MIAALILVYIIGIATGILITVGIIFHIGIKSMEKKIGEKKVAISIQERLNKVKELTNEQLEMLQRADGPQRNALDGKYKNSISRTVKQMEEEKTELLRSILRDGHDPEITTLDPAGVVTKMKLSQYMVESGISTDETTKQDVKAPPKNINKFTVLKGGKTDDNSGNNTTH